MKIRHILLWASVLPSFLFSCYEDEGNYSYHEINELQVEGVEKNYSVDLADSLIIKPELKGSLYSDTSRFTYLWEINSEPVAYGHDLRLQMNMYPGNKYCRYIVTDKETGVKKYYEFQVNVSSSTAGDLIMILSKYQGKAELSYLRLDKPSEWQVNYFEKSHKHPLGQNPQQISINYLESANSWPFVNRYGRIMVLADNQINMIDKSTLFLDAHSPVLEQTEYARTIEYPVPPMMNYKPQFISNVITEWRKSPYGSMIYEGVGHRMISDGRLYYANLHNSFTQTFYHDIDVPGIRGCHLSAFGYWDEMADNPGSRNPELSFIPGVFIMFEENSGLFVYGRAKVNNIRTIESKDYKGCKLLWGSATNGPDCASLAVLHDGNQAKFVMLESEMGQTEGSRIVVEDVNCSDFVNGKSSFYMMKHNDYLFFTDGNNALYRYNIMDAYSKTAPSRNDKVFDLTEFGYGADAVITDICVSRSERTMLVGVSRYGSDAEAKGEEAKGDILFFDLDKGTLNLTYDEVRSKKGVAGIPVDIEIKYQTHFRHGIDFTGVMKDNI